jgi:prophage regulatory protein
MYQHQDIYFYRIPQLIQILNVSKSTIWSWVKDGTFPAPIKLGKNCSAWSSEVVNKWIQSKTNSSLNNGDKNVI